MLGFELTTSRIWISTKTRTSHLANSNQSPTKVTIECQDGITWKLFLGLWPPLRLLLIILDLLVVGLLKEFCDGLQRFLFLAAVGVIHDSGEMSLVLVFSVDQNWTIVRRLLLSLIQFSVRLCWYYLPSKLHIWVQNYFCWKWKSAYNPEIDRQPKQFFAL